MKDNSRTKRGFISEEDLERDVAKMMDDPETDDFVRSVLERMDDSGEGDPEPDSGKGDPPKEDPPEEEPPSDPPEEDHPSDPPEEDSSEDGSGDDPSGDDSPEDGSGAKDDKPEIHYISLDDMMKQTNTTVDISKESSEPTPIFGSSDTKPHDKYRITIKNGNGSVSFVYWAPEKDTGISPKKDEILKSIAKDCADYGSSMTLDEFRSKFGYEDVDVEISQKSYDGFRKFIDDLQKMFPDDYWEFVNLAKGD